MTDKITLGDVTSFVNDTSATTIVNSNSAIIEAAINNTLSRDGTAPNQMEALIDMNNNRIINLPSPVTQDEPVRLIDLSDFVGGGTFSNIPAGGVVNQALIKTGSPDYIFGWEYPVLTGDVTASTSTTTTITANTVTNAKAAQMAAYTLKGNATSGTANAQDLTLSGLPSKTTPASTDLVLIADQSASGALKTSTVSAVGTSSGISSIDTLTGAFTTSNGITSSGNNLQISAARRTLPTHQTFTTAGSGTYTTPTNCLYIKVTLVGGGGGGSASNNGNPGSNGGTTSFGTFIGNPGTGAGSGSSISPPGSGGTGSGGLTNITGQDGQYGLNATVSQIGGYGGGSAFFGGGGSGGGGTGGVVGKANTGGGGGGGGSTGSTGTGSGGGGGGSCIGWINSPVSTYSYTVGAGGGGGSGGANTGGSGGSGIIIIDEFYNS